MNLIFFIHIIK